MKQREMIFSKGKSYGVKENDINRTEYGSEGNKCPDWSIEVEILMTFGSLDYRKVSNSKD